MTGVGSRPTNGAEYNYNNRRRAGSCKDIAFEGKYDRTASSGSMRTSADQFTLKQCILMEVQMERCLADTTVYNGNRT